MNGAFDRQRADEALTAWDRTTDPYDGLLDQLAACVVPDRRIAAISALCKAGESYGYVTINALRDVLRGGS